ncbi:cationic peroxidase 2-like [Silene latifolia]|uniref:cationic peroxidase 2-like n=1 Tax=Silene latifolia TaxID=37657 RepID=UPI003D7882CC
MTSVASFALVAGLILAMGQVGVFGWLDPSELTNKLPISGLQVGYYRGKCPDKSIDIQGFIEHIVEEHFYSDKTTLPAFLRMQFHDCFVNGCDASILIYGSATERVHAANAGVREYDFLDDLKAKVETICPDTVSCADLIAIATTTVLKLLSEKCPQYQTSTEAVLLDQGGGGYLNYYSDDKFDVSFFHQILQQRGVLTIDQALARDPSTSNTVRSFAGSQGLFNAILAQAMVKLQAVDVKTGLDGNIRKVCSKFN